MPETGTDDRKPGPVSLQGIQAPAVTIQKIAPPEIQVNVEAEFSLVVRNVGRADAVNLTVIDPVPDGTRFVSAVPEPTGRTTDGNPIWKFGALKPNQQKIIKIRLLPLRQGEIGSIARMSFQAAASAKTICTRPDLKLAHAGPAKVLKGQEARLIVTIENRGDGVAKNVVIEDEVPAGFTFANRRTRKLAYEVGNLAPGAKRTVTLALQATETGSYVNEVRAKMNGVLTTNHKLGIEVTAPSLKMEINGPTRKYINRVGTFNIKVSNNGTASAKNVLMVTRLPKGLRFVSTNNRGQYNPSEHSVYWSLVELGPQNTGNVELKVMPIGTGEQTIEYEARCRLDRTKPARFPIIVDQLAELFFEVDDTEDPIEVNGETEYRIRVVNQGSKAATKVQVKVEIPDSIQAISSKGPTKGTTQGRTITFAPYDSLEPRQSLFYRIRAKGIRDGDHLIKVLVSSNERSESVAKQESTKVYSEFR